MRPTPARKVALAPSAGHSFRNIVCASPLNALLVFFLASGVIKYTTKDEDTSILLFVFSFIAILPLAMLLAFAATELSMRVGHPLASLLGITLGNTVELIIAILALVKCELIIIQYSLIGSVLVNLLIRLSMSFFTNGIPRCSAQGPTVGRCAHCRRIGANTAVPARIILSMQINSILLTMGTTAILLPAVYISVLSKIPADANQQRREQAKEKQALQLSRSVAIVLLIVYFSHLGFQFWFHAGQDDVTDDVQIVDSPAAPSSTVEMPPIGPSISSAQNTVAPSLNGSHHNLETQVEEVRPQSNVLVTLVLLCVVTGLIGVVGEWLVDSIHGLTRGGHVSKVFVGLVLLQIPHIVEHVTMIIVEGHSMLSAEEAVESSTQIIFFILPSCVILGWFLGKPLTLLVDLFVAIFLFLALIIVNCVIYTYMLQAGNLSKPLEGVLLICLYTIVGITSWFYTGTSSVDDLPSCT